MTRTPKLLFIVLFPLYLSSQETDTTLVQLTKNLAGAGNADQKKSLVKDTIP